MDKLEKAPAGKKGKGLRALPKEVRNAMGFKAKKGGSVKKRVKKKKGMKKRVKAMGGGAMKKRMKAGGRAGKMGGGMMGMKKRMKRGGVAK